jgi:hypothetical protein
MLFYKPLKYLKFLMFPQFLMNQKNLNYLKCLMYPMFH